MRDLTVPRGTPRASAASAIDAPRNAMRELMDRFQGRRIKDRPLGAGDGQPVLNVAPRLVGAKPRQDAGDGDALFECGKPAHRDGKIRLSNEQKGCERL